MAKPTFADVEKLMAHAILPFYHLERDISTPPPIRRLENDAEHSWSLAIVACALAPHIDKQLDLGLISQFATVHDIVEIYAGDTSAMAANEELASKEERERRAFVKARKEFRAFPWLIQTYELYEHQDTPEARFVRSIDKALPLFFLHLDQFRYDRDKKVTLQHFTQHMQQHRTKAKIHEGAFEYYEAVWSALLAHPERFYRAEEVE